ncbi:hypothetical protein P879_01836 [Paragonimus westermani]|uniref:Succinate dehydrogenase assembly factor 2, mitochondrial n=1 Tax=Paragonimus westermani TaxID=34504 RepID=A0A8T0DQ99_9TREM|nr:hypothetical protein P879_01836 [Paragonimus westermani]
MLRALSDPSWLSRTRFLSSVACRFLSDISEISSVPEPDLSSLQQMRFHKFNLNESVDERRRRLVYQSRKRGNLENGILLSTFADEYLNKLSEDQLAVYDALINLPDNEWDIYYWIINVKEVPEIFRSDVLDMLREHALNKNKQLRNQQPALKPQPPPTNEASR